MVRKYIYFFQFYLLNKHISNNYYCSIDVLSNRKMLQMLLHKKGFQTIIQANDGLDAIVKVEQYGINYFDIIFMDSIMPNLNGPQTSTRLRELGYPHLLLGVTGNALDIDVLAFESAGADVVLSKPLKADYLLRLMNYLENCGNISLHPLLLLSSQVSNNNNNNNQEENQAHNMHQTNLLTISTPTNHTPNIVVNTVTTPTNTSHMNNHLTANSSSSSSSSSLSPLHISTATNTLTTSTVKVISLKEYLFK
jgi:CheY-like chemotaxis protein